MTGTVIKNTGSSYTVRTDEGTTVNCKIKGNFRLKGIRTTNPVAVGDLVTLTGDKEENNYITAIEPRRNYIIRKATNLSKQGHILAANLDQVCLVVTLFHPIKRKEIFKTQYGKSARQDRGTDIENASPADCEIR